MKVAKITVAVDFTNASKNDLDRINEFGGKIVQKKKQPKSEHDLNAIFFSGTAHVPADSPEKTGRILKAFF